MAGDGKKRRVLVVGAGAAGSACAWSLSRHPDKFDVHVWEALPVPGGVASSCSVNGGKVVLNDQVQGGAASYRHNLLLLEEHGFQPHPVAMRIAFGIGDKQWTNHSPSPLTQRLGPEIARFGRVLKWVQRFEPLFIFVPIATLLKTWGFSEAFRNEMVFPLTALFFGTGNQTPHVSAAIIARVFLDPKLRLFDYSPDRLLSSVPDMFAFPLLQDIFTTMAARSPYSLHTNRPVAKVVRGRGSRGAITATDAHGVTETFDDLVFACDAETVLKVLGNPTWLERKLLGNVRYYTDYCLTHTDTAYMKRMYDMRSDQGDNYFVRTYPAQRDKIEMSFNLCTYQPHLAQALAGGAGGHPTPTDGSPTTHLTPSQAQAKEDAAEGGRAVDVYQTYYLDVKDRDRLWTDEEVAPGSVLASRWMRQFAHTWTHFASWVPWARFIQGTKHTYYAGSYTLVNTQEVAVMSGLAAAERLGADYPFGFDPLAADQFDTYLFVAHGARRRNKGDAKAAQAAQAAHVQAVERAKGLEPVRAPLQPASETTTRWVPPGLSTSPTPTPTTAPAAPTAPTVAAAEKSTGGAPPAIASPTATPSPTVPDAVPSAA